MADFSELLGKTLVKIERNESGSHYTYAPLSHGQELRFFADDGSEYVQFHSQDCCESVEIEDITGDLYDLIGSPIVLAEVSTQTGNAEYGDTFTWTFYRLATAKGHVTIRWYGSSNGYYSEEVDFERVA